MLRSDVGLGLGTGLFFCVACLASEARPGSSGTIIDSGSATVVLSPARFDSAAVMERYDKLPLAFEENHGQADQAVDYLARGPGYRVLVTRKQVIIDLAQRGSAVPKSRLPTQSQATIRMRFVGANQHAAVSGVEMLPGKTNYFVGADPSKYLTDVPSYTKVRYTSLYPGIDAIYYGNRRQLEYDLVVAPGADPSRIRIDLAGADAIALDQDGNLRVHTEGEEIQLRRPEVYQWVKGRRKRIAGHYIRVGKGQFSFKLAAYDPGKRLVIDPVLSYSTFVGGSAEDIGTAIAVDGSGNTYLAGFTKSSNFPLQGPYDRSLGNNDEDAFITKLNSSGTALVYSTYLGSRNGLDYATAVAVDSSGNVYVTGFGGSDFPTTSGAYQTSAASGASFLAKLNATGSALGYSTFVGGATTRSIAVDAGGNAYLTGRASADFVTSPGALQPTIKSSSNNAFVAKLNPGGTAMAYATFLGGSGDDTGQGIAVDASGNAYVAGVTTSADFPAVGALQGSLQGAVDGFVAKLSPAGTSLIYSTYLGGSLDDRANAIAVDSGGSAYVAGETYSSDFPVRNAIQRTKSGYRLVNSSLGNAFVTKLAPAGDALVYSTFLGGEICTGYCQSLYDKPQYPGDAAYGVAVDLAGHAYVTGLASTYTFPLIDSLLPEKRQDNQDSLFVSKIGSAGTALLYSTFVRSGFTVTQSYPITGAPYGSGNSIAVDSAGAAYVASEADNFDGGGILITAGAFQTTNRGGEDAVAFKLAAPALGISLMSSANPASSQASTTLTAEVADSSLTGTVIFMDGAAQLGNAALSNGTASLTTTLLPGIRQLSAVLRGNGTTADSALLYLVVNTGLSCN
jgi:hypothetical protein